MASAKASTFRGSRPPSTSAPWRSGPPPTRCPPGQLSSSGDVSSSPGCCGERNRPGGYWVAAADPQAASQAVTGTLPAKSLRRAVLLSDGASRLVDLFDLATWELLALLDENGPEELLRQVRDAEAVDPEARQWPRTKRSDDATARLPGSL